MKYRMSARLRDGGARANLNAFLREEDGAAMIEMAFVAIPFFYLIFAIFEVALLIFVSALLNHGVTDIARMVRTNQITATSHDEAAFKQILCQQPVLSIFRCDELQVDLQTVAQFGSPAVPRNDDGTLDTDAISYAPGNRRSINILRVYYDWPITFNRMQAFMEKQTAGSKRRYTHTLLIATQAFVIEP